ncbi:hypothetical protein [Marinifilum caeruleilacunae]|uniref:Outer membrane protein beta-barrel domain-containing protein n=1 Tax=Marinifilum caeruleilacunae TaxID=2499076 RepID=A0ABX1WZ56_9BACT|nr:hypothetical protein [Marinifilum caeruleilacunae]NOU61394.1 hypothetical protein [Marinifilum caeruleilacunae]
MKQILPFLFAFTLCTTLNAQINKGSVITGGEFFFHGSDHSKLLSPENNRTIDLESDNLKIAPQFGFFVNESTLIGLGLTFEHYKYKNFRRSVYYYDNDVILVDEGTYKEKRNLFLINPYLTKYSKLKDRLYFTTRLNMAVGFGKDGESKLYAFRANVTPGLTYFVSDKWALTCNVGQLYYNRMRSKFEVDSYSNKTIEEDLGFKVDFNTFTIGFQYVINKKTRE